MQIRAKAVKCLGCVVECDTRVLSLPEVQAGVRVALSDDSVSVREAAVDVLSKYISTNSQLAKDYFEVICHASSVSVCPARHNWFNFTPPCKHCRIGNMACVLLCW